MRLPHAKFELGFTLIELMVTLAVMAVVLAAAAPSFADFFDKSRVRGAADGVISLIGNLMVCRCQRGHPAYWWRASG
jgi:prepilin-type N-terminal cleavage/methylation domain-containing protein